MPNRLFRCAAVLAAASIITGCVAQPTQGEDDGRIQVMTTTGILADLAQNVAGDRARVISLVPDGGDPHSYEPTLRDVRDIVYTDVAFSNYLMLEEQSLIKALDTNLPSGVPNISLAEEAVKYAAEIIPLVEDVSLDTIWLGLRVAGDGAALGATRTSDVHLSATGVDGPGSLVAYLTGSFGDVDVYFDSTDGFDAAGGFRDDTVSLPPDAHTHLSWAFTEPGLYTLDLQAKLQTSTDQKPTEVATVLETYRSVLRLRREHPVLATGGIRWLAVGDDAVAFVRESADESVLVFAARAAATLSFDAVSLGVELGELSAADVAAPLYGTARVAASAGLVTLETDEAGFAAWTLPGISAPSWSAELP